LKRFEPTTKKTGHKLTYLRPVFFGRNLT